MVIDQLSNFYSKSGSCFTTMAVLKIALKLSVKNNNCLSWADCEGQKLRQSIVWLVAKGHVHEAERIEV